MTGTRSGIASGGNWVVDHVKVVDRLPSPGMLGNILSEEVSPGGAPPNVLADLRRLGAGFPLHGFGVLGDDADGRFLRSRCEALGLDVSAVRLTDEAPTSFTDVMTEDRTGRRTFFHHRGANSLFGPDDVDGSKLNCRIFHLGYLLLLDRMDGPDPEVGTVAARMLRELRALGIKTSVDVVSEESDRYAAIVPPALTFTDYLVINEIEAGRVAGRPVRTGADVLCPDEVVSAVEDIAGMGDMELIAVHMPEGAYLRERGGACLSVGSLQLPADYVRGSVGAGDAFCAGILYGLHEGWTSERSARLGGCCAAASLSSPGATDGVGALEDVLALGERFGERPAPVTL